MNLANFITILRLFVGPLFFLLYSYYELLGLTKVSYPWALLAVVVFSEFSDLIDGYLARKYAQVTDLGKLLDPMADSIARTTIFLTFTQEPIALPLPVIFIFLYRDALINMLRTICALRGLVLAARKSGKLKAIIQGLAAFITVVMMILESQGFIGSDMLHTISKVVITLASGYTLLSAFDYFWAHWTHWTTDQVGLKKLSI